MKIYDTGAAVYVYFGFQTQGLADPLNTYNLVEDAARDEIMKHGGSISHHHGVGKLRKKFMTSAKCFSKHCLPYLHNSAEVSSYHFTSNTQEVKE